MKQIEISDEMYDELIALSNELNTQDHRATAMPYFFQIQEEVEIPTSEGCGEEVWVCDGQICLRTEEDKKAAVFEYKGWDLESKSDNKKFEKLSWIDIENILEENYQKHSVTTIHKYHNAFLTEKACKEHIRLNRYHYSNPHDFLQHAFRNPELEMVLKFITGLTGGKLHK